MTGNGEVKEELTLLQRKKKRLNLYYEREELMLSPDGIQSYGIGSRNIARYNTELSEIRKEIEKLEKEVEEMESEKKPRRAVAVVPMDW